MCDNPNCGELFSEMEEGWTTASQSKVKTNSQGMRNTVTVVLDFCPECSGDPEETGSRLREARMKKRAALVLEAAKTTAEDRTVKRGRGSHGYVEDAIPE